MLIGVPKEIKNWENRIGLTPSGAKALCSAGHSVLIQKNAGVGSGFSDKEYEIAGAKIVETSAEAWNSEMIIKIKEPQPKEYQFLKPKMILFTFLHLAAEKDLTLALAEKKVNAIAYETIQLEDGSLPLLTAMSIVAGKLSSQIAADCLLIQKGGKGILSGGIPGVQPANYLILGAGTVGKNAAEIALGLGANVTLYDINLDKLKKIKELFPKCNILPAIQENLKKAIEKADVIIGAILIPGAKAPKIINYELIKKMQPGSVIVDVSIDQGGCTDVSLPPTSHTQPCRYISLADPTKNAKTLEEAKQNFQGKYIIIYSVPNMPGSVARTSTLGIANDALPYALEIADKGLKRAISENKALAKGINTFEGFITYKAIADTFALQFTPIEKII